MAASDTRAIGGLARNHYTSEQFLNEALNSCLNVFVPSLGVSAHAALERAFMNEWKAGRQPASKWKPQTPVQLPPPLRGKGFSVVRPAAAHSETPPARGLACRPLDRRIFTASIVSTQYCPWQ